MDNIMKIVANLMYEAISKVEDCVIIPTQASISFMLRVSGIITLLELAFEVAKLQHFISWQGALIATIYIAILQFMLVRQDSVIQLIYEKGRKLKNEKLHGKHSANKPRTRNPRSGKKNSGSKKSAGRGKHVVHNDNEQ